MTVAQRAKWIAGRLDSGDMSVLETEKVFIAEHCIQVWNWREHVRAARRAKELGDTDDADADSAPGCDDDADDDADDVDDSSNKRESDDDDDDDQGSKANSNDT